MALNVLVKQRNSHSGHRLSLITALLCVLISSDSQSKSLLTERTDLDVQLQKLIDAENLRRPEDPIFDSAAHEQDKDLRAQATLSLGRIGDPSRAPLVLELLNDREATVRTAAAWAAGNMMTMELSQALHDALQHEMDPLTLSTVMMAVARNGEEADQMPLLAAHDRLAGTRQVTEFVLAKSFEALSTLAARAKKEWNLEGALLSTLMDGVVTFGSAQQGDAARAGIAAAYGLGRFKGDPTKIPQELINVFFGIQNQQVRGFIAAALARSGTADTKVALTGMFGQPQLQWNLVVDGVRALGLLPCDAEIASALLEAYSYPTANLQPKVQVLETAAGCESMASGLVPLVLAEYQSTRSIWLKQSILKSLAAIGPADGLPLARDVVDQDKYDELVAVGDLLAKSSDAADSARLWGILDHRNGQAVAAVVDIAAATADALLPADIKAKAAKLLLRKDLAITVGVASLIKEKKWNDLAAALVQAYGASAPDDVEVKVAILEALGVAGDASLDVFFKTAVADPQHSVSEAAANALKAITGEDLTSQVPPISRVVAVTPSLRQLRNALAVRVKIETNRGDIVVRMRDDAPLTAFNFVALVRRGFYDGLLYHRVVPHFVAQGGDPRGDGYGGPGYMIRDEFSDTWHEIGTLGMASAGKDTPGSQFFFNLRANMHLNGNYTLFAEIVQGLDIANLLEQGDVMRKVSVIRN